MVLHAEVVVLLVLGLVQSVLRPWGLGVVQLGRLVVLLVFRRQELLVVR